MFFRHCVVGQLFHDENILTYRDNHPHSHSHPMGNLEGPVILIPQFYEIFGQWKEARVPGENPQKHSENMQTLHGNALIRESNPGRFCCDATVLTNAPLCSQNLN